MPRSSYVGRFGGDSVVVISIRFAPGAERHLKGELTALLLREGIRGVLSVGD